MNENEYCPNHQDCMVRLSLMENQITELKTDREVSKESYNSLKEEFHTMQLNQTTDNQKIIQLYEKIDEIKNSINSLASDVRALTEKISSPKPDLFKTTMINFGLEVLKIGVIGGGIFYILNFIQK